VSDGPLASNGIEVEALVRDFKTARDIGAAGEGRPAAK
jgi:hypothetical protein